MMGPQYQKHSEHQSNKIGAPKTNKVSPPARAIPVCSKCFGLISRGVTHICTKVQRQNNLAGIVKSSSGRSKAKVTSHILKSICSETGVTQSGGTLSLSIGAAPLLVKVGNAKKMAKSPRFTIEDLKRLQTAHNFSDNATK
jgi:hypothetical protein